MIKQSVFGKTAGGEEVLAFTFENGLSKATILNLGGIIQSLVVPDKNNRPVDVVLGYPDVAGYENHRGYLGALIGRFGNRIGCGKFQLDGLEYSLLLNDRGNHLHGGKEGFHKKIWAHKIVGDTLVLTITSPDGEEGYPGTLKVKVEYTFENGELGIDYTATTDRKTVINLTNHAYFNLNGEGSGSILDHLLQIESEYMVPTNETMIPVGGLRAVAGTPFDFLSLKPIGRDAGADDKELKQGNGYDHCFLLNNAIGEYARFATAISEESGIKMDCYTDLPAVQFYAGNGLHQEGKSGYYAARTGFCLETETIPNNMNVEEYAKYGSAVLDVGQVYHFKTAYRFSNI